MAHVSYVRGAANLTSLAGPEPYSNYALHACECVKTGPRGKKQRLLVHDVVVQTDVCNETYVAPSLPCFASSAGLQPCSRRSATRRYHDVCPPKAGPGGR